MWKLQIVFSSVRETIKKESITYFDTLRSTKFQIYLLVFIV